MSKPEKKIESRIRRKARIRSKVVGSALRPRLSVFRSNANIYAQLIDDSAGKTLLSVKGQDIKSKASKSEVSHMLGKLLAEKAQVKGITEIVFDRGGYLYHGRVKALAEGAREGGLKF